MHSFLASFGKTASRGTLAGEYFEWSSALWKINTLLLPLYCSNGMQNCVRGGIGLLATRAMALVVLPRNACGQTLCTSLVVWWGTCY